MVMCLEPRKSVLASQKVSIDCKPAWDPVSPGRS